MSEINLERKRLNKVKNELEHCRELILLIHDLLEWKFPYSCPIIVGAISSFYMLLWLLDLSVITQASLLLLFVVLWDTFYPTLARFLFSPEKWTGVQEKYFENAIGKLLHVYDMLSQYFCSHLWTRQTTSLQSFLKVGGTLLLLAWLGATVNNLFLLYVATMIGCLWPGVSTNKHVLDRIGKIQLLLKRKSDDSKK